MKTTPSGSPPYLGETVLVMLVGTIKLVGKDQPRGRGRTTNGIMANRVRCVNNINMPDDYNPNRDPASFSGMQ